MDSEDLAAFDFLVGAMAVFWFLASRDGLRASGRMMIGPTVQFDRKFPQ